MPGDGAESRIAGAAGVEKLPIQIRGVSRGGRESCAQERFLEQKILDVTIECATDGSRELEVCLQLLPAIALEVLEVNPCLDQQDGNEHGEDQEDQDRSNAVGE